MKYGVSVIVCCYNSALRLPKTLEHLAAQRFGNDFVVADPKAIGFQIEIILVNNNSTDHTIQVAEEYRYLFELQNIGLKIVHEKKAGQMYARRKGAQVAAFDCIIFCDDDNWLAPDYVRLGFEMLHSDKTIGAGGGNNIPVTEVPPPEWFEEYTTFYGMGIPAFESGDVSYRGFVLGAGLVTRKWLFLQLFNENYPSLLNGRDGQKLSTGDDFEYCKRLLLWGYLLYYNKDLQLEHFVPKERFTIDYRERLMAGIEEAGEILEEYDLAIRVQRKNKNKNRWRLLFLAPFRMLFSKAGWGKRVFIDEWNTFFYLLPVTFTKKTPRYIIKKLMGNNQRIHEEKKI